MKDARDAITEAREFIAIVKENNLKDIYRDDLIDSRDLDEAYEQAMENDEHVSWFKSLRDEVMNTFDEVTIRDGVTLVHERYFKEYAKQLAEDIGATSSNAAWPLYHIDWDAAAEELKQDYCEVDVFVAGEEVDAYWALSN
jgi:hypothetical protein